VPGARPGLACFYDEKVTVYVDGVRQDKR